MMLKGDNDRFIDHRIRGAPARVNSLGW